MVTKCWTQLNAERLAYHGLCDCLNACQRKAELVDMLMDIADHRGIATAANASTWLRHSWPGFASA